MSFAYYLTTTVTTIYKYPETPKSLDIKNLNNKDKMNPLSRTLLTELTVLLISGNVLCRNLWKMTVKHNLFLYLPQLFVCTNTRAGTGKFFNEINIQKLIV